jgi:hypothetical protein
MNSFYLDVKSTLGIQSESWNKPRQTGSRDLDPTIPPQLTVVITAKFKELVSWSRLCKTLSASSYLILTTLKDKYYYDPILWVRSTNTVVTVHATRN